MPATPRTLTAPDLARLLPTPQAWVTLVEETLKRLGTEGVTGDAQPAGDAAGAAKASGLCELEAFKNGRDAATVAVGAKYLAAPGSEVITLLGGDRRGRAIVESVRCVFPNLERMLCFDPDVARQEAFADEIMTQLNLASIIPFEVREATEGAQILVLNLPSGDARLPVIEPDWLQTGTFCASLFPGATLAAATLKAAARRVTDNAAAWAARAAGPSAGTLAGVPAPDAELAAIVAGKAPGRDAGNPMVIFLAFGSPALDAALCAELLRRA
jgi:ornithine cyclodeaminase/alanine dehydrogenase-like protein (mu-crystallin family)